MRTLLSLALSLAAGAFGQVANGPTIGANRVMITAIPLEVSQAAAMNRVEWTLPRSQSPVYCVGSSGISALRFSCPDCNSTEVDRWIQSATKDLTNSVKFPSAFIDGLTLNKSMNGKMLVCEGQYSDMTTGGSAVISTSAVMNILFLDRPTIVNNAGEGPVLTQQGNRFYLQRGGSSSMQLKCQADGNPAPSHWQWSKDGSSLGQGQSLQVGQQLIGESISCGAVSPAFAEKESQAVKISPWDTPKLLGSNLATVQQENQGVFINNKVLIDKTVKLECFASGNPQPNIYWRMQASGNTQDVGNATCTSSQQLLCVPGQKCNLQNNGAAMVISDTVYVVKSECSVVVRNYSFSGNYWCSACNVVSASSQHCEPDADRPATPSALIDVNGPPKRSNAPPSAFQDANQDALVSTYYCADPAPQARQVYWTIADQRLNIGQTLDNYRSIAPRPNGTNCYTAELRISPVTEADTAKTFVLTVQNTFGTERIPVDVRQLLTNGDETSAGADIGLIVGLTLGILFFLCLIIPACMWWRGVACFAGPRKTPPEKFASNIAPEHVRSEPIPPLNGNGYNQPGEPSFSPYGGVYNKGPQAPAERETLSYAALDLVSEPPPAGRSSAPPPDYAHLAHPQPTYPSNSVV